MRVAGEGFLVFDLLSILYFTVVNSDLGLDRSVAGKKCSVGLRNMPLALTCFDYGPPILKKQIQTPGCIFLFTYNSKNKYRKKN